jgi:hypothetical protein
MAMAVCVETVVNTQIRQASQLEIEVIHTGINALFSPAI